MFNLFKACKAFWNTLLGREFSAPVPAIAPPPAISEAAATLNVTANVQESATAGIESKGRESALTLLSLLQREARFVDFIKEDISDYTNDQVGAVARELHKQSSAVVERLFKIEPVLEEGRVFAAQDVETWMIQWSGKSSANFKAVHPGWKASVLNLPQWNGSAESAMLLAPAEVESA